MKRESLILTLTVTLLFVTMFAVEVSIAESTTKVRVTPVEGTADPGAYYSVNVAIENVENLNAWGLKLEYNLAVLDLKAEGITEGSFLSDVDDTDFYFDVTPFGYVQAGCALTTEGAASGNGTIVTFNFLVLGGTPGYCNLTLSDTYLYDINLNEIVHTLEHAEFKATLVPDFTWTPTNPLANETVTFNATGSYSPVGKNIVDYSWNFGDGDTGTGMIVNHTYSAYRKDPYIVVLNVTDEDGLEVSKSEELRIYREVNIADIWVTDQNLDGAYTTINPLEKAEYYPPYGILVTANNLGTVTETFNVTLTFSVPTDLVGYGITNTTTYNVTLGAGTGSGFSLWYDWNPTDPLGNPLPNGMYTFTATATTVEGEINTANNNMSLWVSISVRPLVYVDPTITTVDVGQTFTVNISVTDVDDLLLWMFRLKWNNRLIELNSIVEGPFIKQGGVTFFFHDPYTINDINAYGRINEASCVLLEPGVSGVSGSGTLTTLNFTALAPGTTAIEFFEDPPTFEEETALISSVQEEITHVNYDGSVVVVGDHDVAVASILPSVTEAYIGQIVNITVIVQNKGIYAETFEVAAYYKKNLLLVIGVKNVDFLPPSLEEPVMFSWNTTDLSPGNYTMSAGTSEVPGEVNIDNNIYINGVVELRIMGDANGDNEVGWQDLLMLAMAYGSETGDPSYVSAADFNADGEINWEDLLILAQNYGEEWEQP